MTSIIKHDDTGWINLDSYVSYRKKNGVVYVRAYWGNASLSTSWTIKGTLPSGYRPSADTYFPCVSTSSAQVLAYISGSNGNISLRTNTGTANIAGFSIAYPVN